MWSKLVQSLLAAHRCTRMSEYVKKIEVIIEIRV